MIRPVSAEDLLRGTREAATAGNVRDAVRDLALHALRSRPLTAAHVATVARAVGEGIASCDVPPTAPVRDAHRGAWAGLEDAVGRALLAMELAAREFAEGRAALGGAERERLVAELVRLDRELGEGWGYARGSTRRPRSCARRRPAATGPGTRSPSSRAASSSGSRGSRARGPGR